MTRIRFGIIGLGNIGTLHVDNIVRYVDNGDVVALADVNIDRAKQLAQKYNIDRVFGDYRELSDDKNIDAVVIALPNYLHHKTIITFVESGKHIFCEKPMAITLEEADDVVRRVRKSAVKCQVGYQRHFDKAYVKARKMIESGAVGLPTLAESHTRDPEPPAGWEKDPRLSGGVFFSTCTHDFDSLRWLLGADVRRLYASGGYLVHEDLKESGFFDNAMVFLEFENGVLGKVDASVNCVYGYDVRAEVFGTAGAVRIEMDRATNILEYGKEGASQNYPRWFIDRFLDAYIEEMKAFANSILDDEDPIVTVEDGRAVVEVAVAAQRSAEERRPLELPLKRMGSQR